MPELAPTGSTADKMAGAIIIGATLVAVAIVLAAIILAVA